MTIVLANIAFVAISLTALLLYWVTESRGQKIPYLWVIRLFFAAIAGVFFALTWFAEVFVVTLGAGALNWVGGWLGAPNLGAFAATIAVIVLLVIAALDMLDLNPEKPLFIAFFIVPALSLAVIGPVGQLINEYRGAMQTAGMASIGSMLGVGG
jgi:hypothetical protein